MNNITLKSEWGYYNTLLLPEEGGIELVMFSLGDSCCVEVPRKLALVMFLAFRPSWVIFSIYDVSGTQQRLSELCRKHTVPLFLCFLCVPRCLVKTE